MPGRFASRVAAASVALALGFAGLGLFVGSWQRPPPARAVLGSAVLGSPGELGADRAQGGSTATVYQGPRFTKEGRLQLPADVRRWVFAGSSLGLGYREPGVGRREDLFHTVLIHPSAYDHFVRTTEFPNGTMLALTLYERSEKVPPSQRGYFAGRFVGLEIALKDTRRFEERWGYFSFTGPNGTLTQSAARIPPTAGCNGCHEEHGAVDNVFVQFYPNLRE